MKNNKIQNHESEYFHIKKKTFNLLWKIPLAIIPFVLSYLNLVYGIINNWSFLKLDLLFADKLESQAFNYSNLLIIPELFFEYLLIALSFLFLVYLIKGKLKSYKEEGLIGGLIAGLIGGLIIGLIAGLIIGLIIGLMVGLIWGLIWGLMVGLSDESI